MRISVELVLSLLSQGASHEELKDDYPDLEEEDILACIALCPRRHSGRLPWRRCRWDRNELPHLEATATMTTNNNLDPSLADAELPFGHPGRRFDDTPEYFDHSPLVNQGPEPDYTPDEDGGVVHYAHGDRPLCGDNSMTAVYTDDPALRWPAAPSAWSWWQRTCRTTTITVAIAYTAAARSSPRAGSNGAGWSGGSARTAGRRAGNNG